MLTKTSVLLALGFTLIVGAVTVAHPQSARTGATWEYKEAQLSANAPSGPVMNRLGAEGWELVNVVSACDSGGRSAWWAYFKRRT